MDDDDTWIRAGELPVLPDGMTAVRFYDDQGLYRVEYIATPPPRPEYSFADVCVEMLNWITPSKRNKDKADE